jgi:fatty acid desaturase
MDTRQETSSWRDALTREEIAELLEPNDWRSLWTLVATWLQIAACFALVAVWPNPLTVIVALVVLGTRQLGLAVVMHETSHRTLFGNRRLNDAVGQWLGAYPIWSDCEVYRPYHLQHHSKTGTEQDPDIGLARPFPITRESMRRKIMRDLTGRTGIKFAKGSFKRTFGRWAEDADARRAAIGVTVTNLVIFGVLAALGHPALYLLWIGAWLTTNTLVTRLRSIAEHAMTEETPDPLRNTRTTLTRWWERLLIAPNRVNYHLEHHLLMTVPHYNLPRMHALLKERGALDHAVVEEGGYLGVLKTATSRDA